LAHLKIAYCNLIREGDGDGASAETHCDEWLLAEADEHGLYQSTDENIVLVALQALLVKDTQQVRAGPDPGDRFASIRDIPN
jgi:hypothetical protein